MSFQLQLMFIWTEIYGRDLKGHLETVKTTLNLSQMVIANKSYYIK